jgi:hypothetical protein
VSISTEKECGNKVLRIYGLRRDKMMHNEDLHKQYSPPKTVRMIKSRRKIWAGCVVRMVEIRNRYGNFCAETRSKETTKKTNVGWRETSCGLLLTW